MAVKGWILIMSVILFGIALFEFFYICSLRKNIRKVAGDLSKKRQEQTNTLISVDLIDPAVNQMVEQINEELILLRRERMRLYQGNLELKNAVTNMAHDLRTPLTAIKGYLELLEEEKTEGKVSSYLDIIRERTDTLTHLTEDLFRYSVITSSEDEMELSCLSLKRELEIALAGAYGMLTEKGIEPGITMPETDVVCKLNHDAIQRVFSNILSNISKYSAGDLTVCLRENGIVSFENQAPQLSKVEVEKLFDRFYTVTNAREATGLGLSIAKNLMERMGAEISAGYIEGKLVILMDFHME